MSFQYGQFGTGFLSLTSAQSLRFKDLVETRGEDISIIELTETGEDEYGQPVYSETARSEKAFVERRARERILQPGTVKLGSIRLFMILWAAVQEDGYEVEVDGLRYHITGLVKTGTYLQIEAERKAS